MLIGRIPEFISTIHSFKTLKVGKLSLVKFITFHNFNNLSLFRSDGSTLCDNYLTSTRGKVEK